MPSGLFPSKTTADIRGAGTKLDECEMANFRGDPRLLAVFRNAMFYILKGVSAVCQLDTSIQNRTKNVDLQQYTFADYDDFDIHMPSGNMPF